MGKYSFDKVYQEFASTLTNTQSYFGTDAAPYVLAAFTQNKLANLAGTIVEDINESAPIGKMSIASAVAFADNCDFTPVGTLSVSDVKLTPCAVILDHEICYKDLRAVYNGLSVASQQGAEPGDVFMTALQEVLLSEFNKQIMDRALYATGGTGSTVYDCITGVWNQITTNVTTGGTGSTLTSSNIIGITETMIQSLGNDVLENADDSLVVVMNQKTLRIYQQALAASGAAWGFNPAEQKPRTYDGFRIETISKMADNNLMVFDTKNLALGVGAMDEFSQFSMVDFRTTTMDRKLGITLAGRFDIKLVLESEAAKWYKAA